MVKTDTKISDYINSFDKEKAEALEKLDKLISKAMPGEKKVMWEGKFWGGSDQRIIGYGDVTFINSKKQVVLWFMAGLAYQKNYITVTVVPTQKGYFSLEDYKSKLGKVRLGRSTISFTKIEDVDLETLSEVMEKSYKTHKAK